MTTSEQTFQHLEKIRGRSEDYLNNVLFSRVPQATGTVIYFGGDGMQQVLKSQSLLEGHLADLLTRMEFKYRTSPVFEWSKMVGTVSMGEFCMKFRRCESMRILTNT
jgi:hypothetical protein